MDHFRVLVGGRTGDGVLEAGLLLSRLFGYLGYYVYMNSDYPSIILGGHHYVTIRASTEKISAHMEQVDALVAFNQDALDLHQHRWQEQTDIIFRADRDKLPKPQAASVGMDIEHLSGKESIPKIEEQMMLLGALVRTLGISKEDMLHVWFGNSDESENEEKWQAAVAGYAAAEPHHHLAKVTTTSLPVRTGTDAISLGLLQAGLQAYVAYPMTPTSPVLEFMARYEEELGIHVSLPESEIAVMMQALGYAYMGVRTAVGTSGGGFSLMVEALSLAGQAELPAVIVLGQRAGPGTGMPTYSAQSELSFALSAGHGEFPRLVVSPGDAEEAFVWSAHAMNMAWKYQIPAIILTDKTLCLNAYSFDRDLLTDINIETAPEWDGDGKYYRYRDTPTGVSPQAYAPLSGQAVKSNSYVHDEYGLTSEDPLHASAVVEKRFRKVPALTAEIEAYEPVKVTGKGDTVLVTWGSCKGACLEIAKKLGIRMVQILVMAPFPEKSLSHALKGAKNVICVEQNLQGQLANLMTQNGFAVHSRIGKYDGRPFSVEELEKEVKKVIK
jgi:2-oxoglutarate/2-oxoacid ferredoxin oxidoreductase subunit alpha